MDNKKILIYFFFLLIRLEIVASTIIPIHLGRFYTDRNSETIDTIYLPVDQQFTMKFTVYRHIDSIKEIDNQKYRFLVGDLGCTKETQKLQYNPNDWALYRYLVVSHKIIVPMFVTIYNQVDSVSNLFREKPIDVIYYTTQTMSDICYESFQSHQQTSVGMSLLNYMTLFKYYLLQKIEKETTIVSKESGDLLIDDVCVVILPCKDVVRIREGDSTLFESQSSHR